MTTPDRPLPIAYFTEVVPGTETLRLAAAIVSRGVPTPAARYGGGPLGWLRGVRHRLWLHLGPLGSDVSIAGRPLFGGDSRAGRTISSAQATPQGAPIAYYDDGTHVLRVLGRVVPVPAERTLVALVDATGPRANAPRVVLRLVPTPAVPVPRFDPLPPAGAGTVGYLTAGEQPPWDAALRADPVVRRFLDETTALRP